MNFTLKRHNIIFYVNSICYETKSQISHSHIEVLVLTISIKDVTQTENKNQQLGSMEPTQKQKTYAHGAWLISSVLARNSNCTLLIWFPLDSHYWGNMLGMSSIIKDMTNFGDKYPFAIP